MPQLHLTKKAIENLLPTDGRAVLYRDTKLPGFGLRVSGPAKAFIVEKRVNGRTVRLTIGRYPQLTPDLARNHAQTVLGQMALGVDPIAERRARKAASVTLREALEEYLGARKALKPRTRVEYERECRIAFGDWLDRPLASITRDAVSKRHAEHGAGHGRAAANRAFRVLRAICNFARARYEGADGEPLLPANPVERLTQTRAWFKEVRRQTIVKADQLPAWFEAVEALADRSDNGPAVRDYLQLILFTGLRREEAAQLRSADVDLKARKLTIPDTKNGSPHTLPLAPFVVELLARRRALGILPFVFPGDGATGHLIETRRHLKRVREASGVSFTLHDLRRTFATVAAGIVPAYALKALLNHRSGAGDVTAGYVVASGEQLREHAERVADRLLSLSGRASSGVVGIEA